VTVVVDENFIAYALSCDDKPFGTEWAKADYLTDNTVAGDANGAKLSQCCLRERTKPAAGQSKSGRGESTAKK
jgi:hypothetical protein